MSVEQELRSFKNGFKFIDILQVTKAEVVVQRAKAYILPKVLF